MATKPLLPMKGSTLILRGTLVALVRSYDITYNLKSFCSFSYSALFKKVMGFYIYSQIKIICSLVLGILLYENDRYARWKQSGQGSGFRSDHVVQQLSPFHGPLCVVGVLGRAKS